MENDEFNGLKCCLVLNPEHFANEPKLLSCGHLACSRCILNSSGSIICRLCSELNCLDLSRQPIVKFVQALINANLKDQSEKLLTKYKATESELIGEINGMNEKIDNRLESITAHVEERVEFLKTKLDSIKEKFQQQINEAKNKMKNSLCEICESIDTTELEIVIENLKTDLSENTFSVDKFESYNKKLLGLNKKLDQIKSFEFDVKFEQSEGSDDLNENLIGVFTSSVKVFVEEKIEQLLPEYDAIPEAPRVEDVNLLKNIKASKYQFLKLDHQPRNVIQLQNGNILIGFDTKLVSVYDYNYNLIRKIDRINGEPCKPWGMACHLETGYVYISNYLNNTIYQLDSDLNFVSSLKHPNSEFYGDLCIYDDCLYACIRSSNKIEIISLNLTPIKSHYVDFTPYQIRIQDNVACVLHPNNKTYFYELPSFKLINKYDQIGPILAYKHHFYIYDINECLNGFDKNCDHVEKFEANYGKTKYVNDEMAVIHDKLVVCLNDKRLIIIDIESN